MGFAKVLKNSFFYSVASALQGMISFFLLPVYTRYLSPKDYAILALVTSFTGILSSVLTLQIQNGIPRYVIKFLEDGERARVYFSSVFILVLAVLVFGCVAINIFGDRIIKILFADKDNIGYSPFFQIATWTLLPNLLLGSAMLLLQTLEHGYKFFMVTLIQVLVNVVLGLFLVVHLKAGVAGVLWAQLASVSCALIFILWLVRGWLRFMLPKFTQDIRDSLRYSLPIIPHILSIYIYMYSDRLILQRFVPLADIGIYSMADTFAYILLIIVNATTAAYSPRFLKAAEQDKALAQKEARRFIEIWWVGITIIYMGYLSLAGYVVKFMTRPSFYPAIPLIPILAGGYIFRGLYCFSANSIFYIEKTKLIPAITVTAAAANVVLNLIFIPKFGIYAAAWTTVTSYFITFVMAYIFSKKYFFVQYPWKSMLKIISLLVFAGLIIKFSEGSLTYHPFGKFCFNVTVFLGFSAGVFWLTEHNYLALFKRYVTQEKGGR